MPATAATAARPQTARRATDIRRAAARAIGAAQPTPHGATCRGALSRRGSVAVHQVDDDYASLAALLCGGLRAVRSGAVNRKLETGLLAPGAIPLLPLANLFDDERGQHDDLPRLAEASDLASLLSPAC